jgi:hypothetical protein
MNWFSVLTGAVGGFIGSQVYLWAKARLAQPYRWKCSQCDFKIAMSRRLPVFDEIKVDHMQRFHNA